MLLKSKNFFLIVIFTCQILASFLRKLPAKDIESRLMLSVSGYKIAKFSSFRKTEKNDPQGDYINTHIQIETQEDR